MNTLNLNLISKAILFACAAIIPILFVPISWFSLGLFKVFIVFFVTILLFLGLVIKKIKQDSVFVSVNLLYISMGVIFLSSLLSTIFSNNTQISLLGRQISEYSFFGFVTFFALAYVVYSLVSEQVLKTKLLLTLFISSVATVLMHLFFILVPFMPSFGFFVTNTISTVGGWYDLGYYALFAVLSSVLILYFYDHIKLYKVLGYVGLIAGMILMILVNSKEIFFISLFFSLAYVIFTALSKTYDHVNKKLSYEALFVFIVSVLFILIGSKTGVLLNSAFNVQTVEPRPGLVSTFEVVKQVVLKEPFQNKVFGVGPDRFDVAWLSYRPFEVNMTGYWDTDFRLGFSTLGTISVTQGIFGILAWLFFIGTSLYFVGKLLLISVKSKNDLFVYTYAVFGYVFFLTLLLVHTPSFVLLTLGVMCIGIFVSSLTHSKIISYKEIKINKSPRISFVYILVLVFLLIASIYIGYVYASQYSSRVIFERATMEYSKEGDIQKTRSEIQKAQFIFGSDVYSRGLIELDLLEINQIIQNKELSQEQATIQFTQGLRNIIGQAQAMIAYDPNSYVNSSFLIMIYKNLTSLGVQDAKEETLRLIDSTSLLTPQNPTLALEKARVYVLGKEYDLAIEEIKKAIELKPNYVDAVFLLSQIQVEKGEIEQAIASIQAGIQVDQYNPNLRFQLGLLYYNQQKFNDAITYFENAIMLSPNFANAKYFLGLSYYKNNRTSDAITLFENLRTQIPDNQEIQLILNNLKTGQDPFMGAQPPLNTEPEDREELPLEDTLDESAENE